MLNVHGIHDIYGLPFYVCVSILIYILLLTHTRKVIGYKYRVYRVGFVKEYIWRLV